MSDSRGLSEAETAYVRRFWYEVVHGPDGPHATLEDCRGYYTCHYYDLATLAAGSGRV